jgi:hypothetical protein
MRNVTTYFIGAAAGDGCCGGNGASVGGGNGASSCLDTFYSHGCGAALGVVLCDSADRLGLGCVQEDDGSGGGGDKGVNGADGCDCSGV